jgi:polyhydroxybutyrate depolymerase
MKRLLAPLLFLLLASLACARTAPAAEKDSVHTLNYGGLERTYILHVPPAYEEGQPAALVLSLHGGGGNADLHRRMDGFDELADEKGFIVVYPNGTGKLQDALLTWNGGTCCGYAQENEVDDVGFLRALIAELESEYAIDPRRIYVTGISNGGIMAYRLACEASDLIAAIAPVAGTLNYEPCQPARPVSVIHFHGTDDTHLPYDGGVGADSLTGVSYNSVAYSLRIWLDFDQCPPVPQTESFADIRHDAYACAEQTAVELYTILGGKHAWPGSAGPAWRGGDEPTQTISASQLIWEFFAAHPKP